MEKFRSPTSTEYSVNGNWTAAEVKKESIHVKGQQDDPFEVDVTRHGPLMERAGATGYALKWTATQPGGLAHTYFGIQFARDWQDLRERLRDAAGPAQNLAYADVDGHIGFLVAARIPIRKCPQKIMGAPCGAVPLPGDTDDYEWQGYIPFEELPQALDPPGGIIGTANASIAGPGYAHFLTANPFPPWRTDRIYTLLGAPKKFTPADFAAMQTDIVSEIDHIVAQALVKASASATPKDARTATLISGLRSWDGSMAADSVQAIFIEQVVRDLERIIFKPFLGANADLNYPRTDVFLDKVLRERPAAWLPSGFSSYDELLVGSADQAVADLTKATGRPDTSTWKWGERNALFMAHPMGRSGLLARMLSIGPIAQSGAHDCIKAMGPGFGPSM
ncbi:MAG: penicillin acylase family protein, partial [Bryobacteraceae bacterium]